MEAHFPIAFILPSSKKITLSHFAANSMSLLLIKMV
jgi:hypothetical protein